MSHLICSLPPTPTFPLRTILHPQTPTPHHPTAHIQHPTSFSSFIPHPSSFIIAHHSSLIIHPSSLPPDNSTFITHHHSHFITHHSPLNSEMISRAGHSTIFGFVTTTTQQRNITSGTSQGPEKNGKTVRPQCLDRVATINIVKWQLQTTLWPCTMFTLSRQNCRVPSSATYRMLGWPSWSLVDDGLFVGKTSGPCDTIYILSRAGRALIVLTLRQVSAY